MNIFKTLLLTTALTFTSAYAQIQSSDHGGGNGGDDLEIELKKRSLQIAHFVKSEMGAKVFKMINADNLIDTANMADIDVATGNVTDKHGVLRTCVNHPERSLIVCNLGRINELKASKKEDILTAMLFHELLGLMEVELGYLDNVSMYPISSKILEYTNVVINTPIQEAQIRPEFYGLDHRSYGKTFINQKTNETLRLICLYSNVEVHRCNAYTVVRNVNGIQAPLIDTVKSVSKNQILDFNFAAPTEKELKLLTDKLERIQEKGFKYLTLKQEDGLPKVRCWRNGGPNNREYTYGAGLGQLAHEADCDGDSITFFYTLIPIMYPVWAFDTVVEAGKQTINVAVFPIKGLVSAIKISSTNKKIKKLNKRIQNMSELFNQKGVLSLVGTSQAISESDFVQLTEDVTHLLTGEKK